MARRRRNQKQQEETLVDLVEARDRASGFFEENQKLIIGVVGGLLLIVGGYFAYRYLYLQPREKSAMEAMYQAQVQFERDSFALALDNPGGGNDGFLDVIDNYGGTKAANTAKYYAGVSWLNLGEYQAAADLLKSFSAKGEVLPTMKHVALGDAYAELNDMGQAEKSYKRAANTDGAEFVRVYALKKLGLFYESQGKPEQAAEAYAQIKQKYPKSPQAQDIEKYLSRVGG